MPRWFWHMRHNSLWLVDSVCSKLVWDFVVHMVTSIPLPSFGKSQILFIMDNRLLTVQAPLKGGLPDVNVC
jgi:hypothetical protein